MSDERSNPAGAAEGPSGAQFQLQRIYLKDLSFESPMMVSAIRPQWQPKVNQDLNTAVNKLDGDIFEVVLKMTINVEADGATAFLVEVQQAGLFVIKGVEGPQLAQVLNTMCPQILYPYAREVIDSCATRGGFPALALPPINFDVLFARALQEQKKAQAEKSTADASVN